MKPILGYWKIRGYSAPIRYLLWHANVDYEDKHYNCGPPPKFERSEWLSDKTSLGFDFPNLPYYIDGDTKLTQSQAILRHLARKYGFEGRTEADKCRVDLVVSQLQDYNKKYVALIFNPEFAKLRDSYVSSLAENLEPMAAFLGDRKFITGDYVTFADFFLFEYLECNSFMKKGLLDDYPVLDRYRARMKALDGIDRYFKSPGAIEFPFAGAPAYFGGPYSELLAKSAKPSSS